MDDDHGAPGPALSRSPYSLRSNPVDPTLSIAVSIQQNPGVYALLERLKQMKQETDEYVRSVLATNW